jgi:hypothetical protein
MYTLRSNCIDRNIPLYVAFCFDQVLVFETTVLNGEFNKYNCMCYQRCVELREIRYHDMPCSHQYHIEIATFVPTTNI